MNVHNIADKTIINQVTAFFQQEEADILKKQKEDEAMVQQAGQTNSP